MPLKLTYEFVRSVFSQRGYELIDEHYIGKDVTMRYRCSYHADAQLKICYNALRNGHGCPFCASDRTREKLKLPFTEVVTAFNNAGYTLLSLETDYENSQSKLYYRCSNHADKPLSISLSNLKAGKRCKFCSSIKVAQKLTTPIAEVQALFEAKGLVLLDESYSGKGKIRFRCPKHPDKPNRVTLSHLKDRKHVCPYCAKHKVDYEDVKEAFAARNCELLDNVYINDRTIMRFCCLFHPDEIYEITYNKFRSGFRGCHECSGFHYANYEEVKEAFHKAGYELLDTVYSGAEVDLKYKCPFHPDKDTRMTYRKLCKGRICRYCKNPYYSGEGDVKWKGGITKISDLLRQSVANWKRKVLQDHRFECLITGRRGSLEVHHTSVPFHVLRDQVLQELNYPKRLRRHEFNDDELEQIVALFLKKHRDIIGVALLKSVHKLFHSIYGLKATTEDLLAFKERYQNGEFQTL